jgi:NAD(P)-dependent dehydrogenase (short-subunit alcohol dehydrogenase family)
VEDDELLGQFDTNVFGVVRMIRAVVPAMREQGAGTIVNVSSIVASVPPPFSGMYAASKGAINALTYALHYELAPVRHSARAGGARTLSHTTQPEPCRDVPGKPQLALR